MHNSLWLEVPAKQTLFLKKKKMCEQSFHFFFTDLLTSKQFHNSPEFSVFKKKYHKHFGLQIFLKF